MSAARYGRLRFVSCFIGVALANCSGYGTQVLRWINLFAGGFALCLGHAAPAADAERTLSLRADAIEHAVGGRTDGCGVRVTGGEASLRSKSLWIDFSFNAYRSGAALVQALAYDIPPTIEGENRTQRLPLQRAWLKPEAAQTPTRLGENTELRERLVYAITLDEATALFDAVAHGQPLSIGFRPWGVARESVVAGVAALDEPSRTALEACLARLVN